MTQRPKRPYSPQHEEGYQDGLAGRPPTTMLQNYSKGYAMGQREAKRKAAA